MRHLSKEEGITYVYNKNRDALVIYKLMKGNMQPFFLVIYITSGVGMGVAHESTHSPQ